MQDPKTPPRRGFFMSKEKHQEVVSPTFARHPGLMRLSG
jgi:hypothetical protein